MHRSVSSVHGDNNHRDPACMSCRFSFFCRFRQSPPFQMAAIAGSHPASPCIPGPIYSGYAKGVIIPRVWNNLNPLVYIIRYVHTDKKEGRAGPGSTVRQNKQVCPGWKWGGSYSLPSRRPLLFRSARGEQPVNSREGVGQVPDKESACRSSFPDPVATVGGTSPGSFFTSRTIRVPAVPEYWQSLSPVQPVPLQRGFTIDMAWMNRKKHFWVNQSHILKDMTLS